MPILEEDMDYGTMVRRSKTHKCAACGAGLGVAWGQSLGYGAQYILRCGRKIAHDVINEPRVSARDRAMLNTLRGETGMDSTALMKMDEATMLARVNKAQWPQDMKQGDRAMLATVAVSYGLDPLLGELLVYRGAPFITINARYRKAQETGLFDGMESRPATTEERKARDAVDGDVLYRCEVYKNGVRIPFVGWGRVRKAEQGGSQALPINSDPHRMAEKRSEAMALRKAFSMPIPENLWADRGENGDDVLEASAEPVEGDFKEVKGEDAETPPEPEVEAGPDAEESKPAPVASADMAIPAVKKAKPPTQQEYLDLAAMLEECTVTRDELGNFCNGDPHYWDIHKLSDLSRGQFETVKAALGTGVLKAEAK